MSAPRLGGVPRLCGLDLGARAPEETAASITAEIIAAGDQGPGLPLARLSGPGHQALVLEAAR